MSLAFKYEVALQLNDGTSHKFSLEEKGWAKKEQLKRTKEISLIPSGNTTLPVVACQIPDGAKPVVKSRVYGHVGSGGAQTDAFRAYAIGYKPSRRKPYLIWILPNGTIEVADDPVYAPLLLSMGYQEPD